MPARTYIQGMNKIRDIFGALALSALSATASFADDMNYAELSLLKGWRENDGTRIAAVRITLAQGWHTYWRAPGDAGIPPRFDWTGSNNVERVDVHWPVPSVYSQNGMRYVGYEGEVILPIEIKPTQSGDIDLEGVVEFGVCDDICMPMRAEFSISIAEEDGRKSTAPMIAAALRDRPKKLGGVTCSAAPIDDGMTLSATMRVPALGAHEVAVIEHPDRNVWVSEAMLARDGRTLTATSELVPPEAAPFMIDRSQLTFTVIGDGTAYEAQGCSAG